ncbi:hypothetical protein JAAARDRAFT_635632 [Jaapia argillacea MUCL 33604]|uniref:Uncharacterized protein n=1 Tax=Jaapia argillacea MUCL 33604 TaxID=933084 RepID=A0A067Q8S4_9AGAM|nr:hypothetical protein JAAARDRAFT_635632 [Jaapia argillacea MUCL 33604]
MTDRIDVMVKWPNVLWKRLSGPFQGSWLFRRQPLKDSNGVPKAPGNRHIPLEILAEIFRYLQPAWRYCEVYAPRGDRPSLRDLNSAILVCRAWYASGLEFLYRNPYIDSARRIRSLKHAITANHRLADLIQSIVIPESPHYYNSSLPRRFFRPQTVSPRTNLIHILKACTNLHSISIADSSLPARRPFHILSGFPNLTSLKRLCLSGLPFIKSHSIFLFPCGSLPCLEELYVENTVIDWLTPNPALPSLHTLSLSMCESTYLGSMIPSHLTGIQHVELVDTSASADSQNHIYRVTQLAHTLISLAILRTCNIMTPTVLDPSKFRNLRHLTLDLTAFIPNQFATPLAIQPTLVFNQLPPKLVTLTILVPFYEDFDAATSEEATDLQRSIRQSLTNALWSSMPPIHPLKHIYIEGSKSIWGPTTEGITNLLESKGIKVTLVLIDDMASQDDLAGLIALRRSHLRSQDHGGSSISFGQP